MEAGSLLPFGSYKGWGLSFFYKCELLGSSLVRFYVKNDDSVSTMTGLY